MSRMDGGGFGGSSNIDSWQLVESKTVSVATTIVDFDAVLDGNNDNGYRIEVYHVNDGSVQSQNRLRINGSDWAVNRQYLLGNGSTASAGRDNGGVIVATGSGDESNMLIEILFPSTGHARHAFVRGLRNTGTSVIVENYNMHITTPNSSTNITSLGLSSNITKGIGAGTMLRLYKLVIN